MNFSRMLFIESFVWIPASEGVKCELVCYHKLGVMSLWRFEEKMTESVENEETSEINKKTPNKKSKKPVPPSDVYSYECKLVKVITNHCLEPFSVKRLFLQGEIKTNERVLNIEYVKLGEAKHCLSVSKNNGTIELWQIEDKQDVGANDTLLDNSFSNTSSDNVTLDTDTALNNASLNGIGLNEQPSQSLITNGTENESIANEIEGSSLQVTKVTSIKRTSSCKENDVALENSDVDLGEETTKLNSNIVNGHLAVKMNGTLEDVNKDEIEDKFGDEKVAQKRKRNSDNELEEVRNKKIKLSDKIVDETNRVENSSIHELEKTDGVSNNNENSSNEKVTEDKNELENNKNEQGKTDSELSTSKDKSNEIEGSKNKNLAPIKYVVHDKNDNIVVSNLIVSYIDDNVLIVFSKLSFICFVLLDNQGIVIDSGHMRIQTRFITTMVKFVKNKYMVVTFENKILFVSISVGKTTESGLDSNENGLSTKSIGGQNRANTESIASVNEQTMPISNEASEKSENEIKLNLTKQNDSSFRHVSIAIRKSIDLSNATHTINGIANSTNSFLTVLSFRIKVKYESCFKSSRNPCQLALTTFHSTSRFLSSQIPNQSSSIYKQIDIIKFISLNNINFFRLNSICINIQNVQLKYFLIKLFKPKLSEGKKSQFNEVLTQVENIIYLKHIKKCIREGVYREDHQVLILLREWIKHTFPADKHDLKKLASCFPTEDYNELCVICSSKISSVDSFQYAVCSDKHRVIRCSLSLLQCLGSFVQCQYCSAFASKKYALKARCVFCDAWFPLN
ncbi:hypothetical protein WDU94_006168 [Cyamophila willieti]